MENFSLYDDSDSDDYPEFNIKMDDYQLKETDVCATLCGIDEAPLYYYNNIRSLNGGHWYVRESVFHRIYNKKKKQLKIYYRYIMHNDNYVKKYDLHYSKYRYISNEHVTNIYKHPQYHLKYIPTFEIDYEYILAPIIIDTRKSKCIAILTLFNSLPAEIVNIIYKMCGGICAFVPAQHVLDYTDFSCDFITTYTINSPLTTSELITLYNANKLILHYIDGNSSIALTEEAFMYKFLNYNSTCLQDIYESVEQMIETRDKVITEFISRLNDPFFSKSDNFYI